MGGSGKLAAPPPLARPAERASWGSLLRQR
ncbi:MAG: hypothetical protein JWO22_2606, partial [Frankiales bacterium]|nr:hypothetical protein [Frankiales bacterium]